MYGTKSWERRKSCETPPLVILNGEKRFARETFLGVEAPYKLISTVIG
jgi:hypothetical protein